MEWIGLGVLLPLLLCGGMCVVGAVAAFFGFRRASDSSQDMAGSTPAGDLDDWDEWFDGPQATSPFQRTGGRA